MKFAVITVASLWGILFVVAANGQQIVFELQGQAGPGLTSENEPGDVANGGSGDIGRGGVTLDLSSRSLSVDIEWGSANGHSDLSSDVDFMNIHGPTESAAPDNFSENAETFVGLGEFDSSASGGSFVGDVSFEGSLKELFEGRFYFHLHTFENGGGEARGYFIPEVVLGDVNGDNAINLLDVAPFVAAVSQGQFIDQADMNRDGSVDLLDVSLFVSLLAD